MEPNAFMDLDTLKTLMGQTGAILMLTQVAKSAFPALSTYRLRAIAIASGIVLNSVLVWHSGMPISNYALSFINGSMAAMLAMKSAEFIKGNGN